MSGVGVWIANHAKKRERRERLMFVAERYAGQPGRYVSVEETVRGFREILEGKHDQLPEDAFYMVGTIDEAVEKARQMQAA